jgi:hypothetical protein
VEGHTARGWKSAPDCDYRLITNGVTWPNIIFLEYPDNRSTLQADHATLPVDWKAIRAVEKEVERAGFNRESDYLIATCVGLFVTFADLDNRVSPGVEGARRLGFGPAGLGAPAQLLLD